MVYKVKNEKLNTILEFENYEQLRNYAYRLNGTIEGDNDNFFEESHYIFEVCHLKILDIE